MPLRPTVRLRLALLFGVMFFMLGVTVLTLALIFFRESLSGQAPVTPRDLPRLGAGLSREGDWLRFIGDIRQQDRSSALREAIRGSLLALLAGSVLAMALGWIVADQALRPLRRIIGHVRTASERSLDQPLRLQGPDDELRELADTYDAMLDRLRTAFESRRRFAANVSHELRTPLAIIQAEAEVMMAAPDATPRELQAGDTIRTVTMRSERLIDGLLALSRAESVAIDRAPVDLAELTGDIVGDLAPLANARRIEIDLRLGEACVTGDRVLLEQCVANLVNNAIRHNVDGGWIVVEVDRDDDRRYGRLRVTNTGQPVPGPPGALFLPFHRGQGTAPEGVGLGLAIVHAVVDAHGGAIAALPRVEGGLEVVTRLPVAP
jgi:signal transduction histidine kinase